MITEVIGTANKTLRRMFFLTQKKASKAVTVTTHLFTAFITLYITMLCCVLVPIHAHAEHKCIHGDVCSTVYVCECICLLTIVSPMSCLKQRNASCSSVQEWRKMWTDDVILIACSAAKYIYFNKINLTIRIVCHSPLCTLKSWTKLF